MTLSELIARFRLWQLTPVATEPLKGNEQHVCRNCGESYDGRYCPRCGQTARTMRLTLRNVTTSALDVWGAGNRSMPRNIVHLLLRPGYMVGDYLRGHRQPYFPPFKMLFIMVATFLMLTQLLRWVEGYDEAKSQSVMEQVARTVNNVEVDDASDSAQQAFEMRRAMLSGVVDQVKDWFDDHQAISIVVMQGFVAIANWIVFRRSRRLPRLTLSEQVFVQVFLSNQVLICSSLYFLLSLLWVHGGDDDMPQMLTLVIYIIDYKQLFGFSWWGTIWRSVLALVLLWTAVGLAIMSVVLLVLYPLMVE